MKLPSLVVDAFLLTSCTHVEAAAPPPHLIEALAG
jgi:hypothetical protein